MIKVIDTISSILNPIAVVISLGEFVYHVLFTGRTNDVIFLGILFAVNAIAFLLRFHKEG